MALATWSPANGRMDGMPVRSGIAMLFLALGSVPEVLRAQER